MSTQYTFDNIHLFNVVQNVLLPLTKTKSIFTFKGPLGVGKTTIIKTLLKSIGVEETVTSPTFNYVNGYESKNGLFIYHFDLYRIETLQMFLDYGFEEYLYEKGTLICIEWPEVIFELLENPLLTKKVCKIELSYKKDSIQNERILTIL